MARSLNIRMGGFQTEEVDGGVDYYGQFVNPLPDTDDWFAIGSWNRAFVHEGQIDAYEDFGLTTMVAVEGPELTDEQMIRDHNFPVIIYSGERERYNDLGSEVKGWLVGDEYDMSFGPGYDQYNTDPEDDTTIPIPNACTGAFGQNQEGKVPPNDGPEDPVTHPPARCGYTGLDFRYDSLPADGKMRYANFGKAVGWWYVTDDPSVPWPNPPTGDDTISDFITDERLDVASIDAYWMTDGSEVNYSPHAAARAASTGNLTLSGTQTVDGVALIAGDRVLVKNQTTASQNGVYDVATGAWTRVDDANAWDELVEAFVYVEEGTTNAESAWVTTIAGGGTLGTTNVTWALYSEAGEIVSGWSDIGYFTDGEKRYGKPASYGWNVDRVRQIRDNGSPGNRIPVWNYVETGWPSGQGPELGARRILPAEAVACVWHSIIAGARGVIYFDHNFGPPGGEKASTIEGVGDHYADTRAALKTTNELIMSLAPVLNSPTVIDPAFTDGVNVRSLVKDHGGYIYVFSGSTLISGASSYSATFELTGLGNRTAEVIGESRNVTVTSDSWTDTFANGNAIHIYKIPF